jgi:hypothetical protein
MPPKPAQLLRWYPRAWRERYGEELLALIQDNMDEGRPAWRLRLSVTWGGLRERAHEARRAAAAPFRHPGWPASSGTMLTAGLLGAVLPSGLAVASSARAWQAVTLDALLAAIALTGAIVLADGLVALPALVRFVRAGGRPKIWRRAGWAAGSTSLAGGGLAGLVVFAGSPGVSTSWGYWAAALATGLAAAAAIGLWAAAATATARQLTLAPRVRAAQLVLGAVMPTAISAVIATMALCWSANHASVLLLVVAGTELALAGVLDPGRIGRAVRRGRRLRSGGRVVTRPRHAGD